MANMTCLSRIESTGEVRHTATGNVTTLLFRLGQNGHDHDESFVCSDSFVYNLIVVQANLSLK